MRSGAATSPGTMPHARGTGPEDIDVAQVYENFTGQVMMALEDFGLFEPGKGGPPSSALVEILSNVVERRI
jgi:acetyl-CoA acetyltransferase